MQFVDKSDNLYLDNNHTLHLKGFCYRISFFYDITRTQIHLFFNPRKLSSERFLEILFWDLSEFIESTDFLEAFCFDIEKQLELYDKNRDLPTKNYLDYVENNKKPSETVVIHEETHTKNHIFQYYATFFDKGEYDFETSSKKFGAIKYGKEVYRFLKCFNWYFHNFKIECYFSLDYLDILKDKFDGYGNEFINLRFCKEKLIITFKRAINDLISCSGNILEVLDNFLVFGYKELYSILLSFDIKTINFKKSLRLESYVSCHLAKDIGCNVEIEQPELLKRLKLNQMNNNKESLSYIGLKFFVHYLDFSHGYWEHEIEYDNQDGMSRVELERDLLVLEPDIRPKEQTTLDKYLDKNSEYYNHKTFVLLKGYLPITEFSIEPNGSIGNTLQCNISNEYYDFIISDKSFSNEKFITTKFRFGIF